MRIHEQHAEPAAGSSTTPEANPPRRRRRRGIGVLPSLFTLGNCLCGFSSIHYASLGQNASGLPIGNYAVAGYFIFGAMLFDMFDGFVARITRSTSDFGAELDSLADMVSFGVAPAFLSLHVCNDLLAQVYAPPGQFNQAYQFMGPWADSMIGKLFWIIGLLYVSCTALRLARFNVFNRHDVESHQIFRGLPSPGAAGVVASTIIFLETLYSEKHLIPLHISPQVKEPLENSVLPYLIPIVLLTSAMLMVSRFAYAHLINRFLRGRRRFSYIVWVVLVVMFLLWEPQITALVAIYIYAASAPVGWLWRVLFKRGGSPSQSVVRPTPASPRAT